GRLYGRACALGAGRGEPVEVPGVAGRDLRGVPAAGDPRVPAGRLARRRAVRAVRAVRGQRWGSSPADATSTKMTKPATSSVRTIRAGWRARAASTAAGSSPRAAHAAKM